MPKRRTANSRPFGYLRSTQFAPQTGKLDILTAFITSSRIAKYGYNKSVTIWNHYIKMEETSQTTTKYTDMVDLYAGWLTSLAAWWALKFYRHRQRKWQRIAKTF